MKRSRLQILLGFVLIVLIPSLGIAQDDLNIHGVVSDAFTSSKVDGVKVAVQKDGSPHDAFTTRANGKYEFYLDVGHRYDLIFSKDGYVTRSIVIDSRNVPPEVLGAGIIMPTDMSMYPITDAMADADLSVFDKPIGKAAYDAAEADLVWDFNYTNTVKSEIMSFMRDMEKKQKELDKQADASAKAEEEREEQFNQLVADGDKAMGRDNYEDAVLNYQAALKIKPEDGAVQAKLGDAQTKWNAQKAAEKLEADYSAALDAGDGFMRTEEYDKAITSYQTALELKPGEAYPEEQIAEANRIIEERAANRAKQERFNDLMAEATAFADEKEYQKAIDKFDEALTVLPGNGEAESKREKAREALAAQQEAEQKRAEYEEVIAAADALFDAENYGEALSKYEAAAELMPDEAYPPQRIETTQNKMDQLREAAEKQEEFDALMASGNEALGAVDYEKAIEDFEQALKLLPNNPEAQSKLEQARGLLAEVRAEEELQEQYDAAIEAADASFDEEEYQTAKEKYLEAKELKPEEEYPTARISEIDRKLAELAEEQATQEAYGQAMTAAQNAMSDERFEEAVERYEEALTVIPEDAAATEGRDEAQEKLRNRLAQMEKQSAYEDLIASADAKLADDQLEAAKAEYEEALKVLPDEEYPSSQIAVIDDMMAEREAAAALQADFDALVQQGDAAADKDSYREAIDAYTQALELMESAEVEDKLTKAKDDLADLEARQDLEQRYTAAIDMADQHFDDEKLEQAKSEYQRAAEMKPDETYPAERIDMIDERLAELAEAEAEAERQANLERVNALVLEGDRAAADADFQTAIDKYTEALDILPERQDVADKLAQAEKDLLATQEQAAIDEAYMDAIAQADADFDDADWEAALKGYGDALDIKPEEDYPKDRMAEAQAELDRLAEESEMERRAELQEDFDKLIASGDRDMAKNKFDKALEDYREALALMPDNATAKEKVDQATRALEELEAEEADLNRYDDLIEEADDLFDEESYEMAKLKYLDASDVLPDREYPHERIAEIDRLMEKLRLREENLAREALRDQYDAAISRADDLMAEQNYEDARDAYEEALEILPEETYPPSQIERIELLIEEREQTKRERERLAQTEKKPEREQPRERERVEYNRVNADSEDQAERFMREAREAQEKERYERIKNIKENHRANEQNYIESSRELREDNMAGIRSQRAGIGNLYSEAKAIQEEKVENSQRYKKAILTNATKRTEMSEVQNRENYKDIQAAKDRRTEDTRERAEDHREEVKEVRTANEERMAQRAQWHRDSYAERKEVRAEMREVNARRAAENQEAMERRAEASEEVNRQNSERRQFVKDKTEENREEIKRRSRELEEQKQRLATGQSAKNDAKVEQGKTQTSENRRRYENALEDNRTLAEDRRNDNYEAIQEIETGSAKTPDEYHRSALAEDYPLGVTEESSTMGNKVIITRVVVKGNRGDEYKKVVDKAGNYYFKNGRSISEHTWNRETIEAFNKSKD